MKWNEEKWKEYIAKNCIHRWADYRICTINKRYEECSFENCPLLHEYEKEVEKEVRNGK